MKELLTYDSRDDRWHGVQSDGIVIQIGSDEFAEAVQDRIVLLDEDQVEEDEAQRAAALAEASDPDGWHEDMAGWIPAGE